MSIKVGTIMHGMGCGRPNLTKGEGIGCDYLDSKWEDEDLLMFCTLFNKEVYRIVDCKTAYAEGDLMGVPILSHRLEECESHQLSLEILREKKGLNVDSCVVLDMDEPEGISKPSNSSGFQKIVIYKNEFGNVSIDMPDVQGSKR